MPALSSSPAQHTPLTQNEHKLRKPAVRLMPWHRVLWLLCAGCLAWSAALSWADLLTAASRLNPAQGAMAITAFATAFIPALIVIGYGARMHKWGLWFLVLLSISGIVIKNLAL
ncbi:hypothetical protein [Acetobacter thailandicus]|uniref:hypothetical protein n=1 Tax=Acetobacter thailandicus TaxID=1502842 RepID=UPI001BA46BE9|nr:hypothetical protein [Acetobacter thailandicus]MBS0960578.1 hypothetical protein [Acetobacter thailandicus]